MKTQYAGARSGLIRALIAVWLLAGVFAMHGLTGNHEVALATTHAIMPPHGEEHAAATHQMPVSSNEVTVQTAPDGHDHSMGDVCLAMLTVLALAIIGALAARSLLAAHPVVLRTPTPHVVTAGLSPPWAQPSLSRLCVLRT
jgi:hypothetical protein